MDTTNNLPLPPAGLPELGVSFIRVLGALALVLALFLAGVWLFRNWQRLVLRQGRPTRLSLLEVRSLGNRHTLYVVGYETQRLLLAVSPAGVQLLSHLPDSTDSPAVTSKPGSFPQALAPSWPPA